MLFMRTGERSVDHCLLALVTVGSIDRHMIGCTASEVVLRLSRLHYRYCYHSFRQGRHVPMVLFVEIGEFYERLTNSACNVPPKLKTCLAISTTPPGAGTVPASAKMACEKKKIARYSFPILLRSYSQRLSSKDRVDDEKQHMACSVSHLMPLGSNQPCMGLHTFRLAQP